MAVLVPHFRWPLEIFSVRWYTETSFRFTIVRLMAGFLIANMKIINFWVRWWTCEWKITSTFLLSMVKVISYHYFTVSFIFSNLYYWYFLVIPLFVFDQNAFILVLRYNHSVAYNLQFSSTKYTYSPHSWRRTSSRSPQGSGQIVSAFGY